MPTTGSSSSPSGSAGCGWLGERAGRLTGVRTAAAATLGERVTVELGHLAMGKTQVIVAVSSTVPTAPGEDSDDAIVVGDRRARATRHGVDDVEILLGSGSPPFRSVTKAASGGELSRVMLAIEVVTAGAGSR